MTADNQKSHGFLSPLDYFQRGILAELTTPNFITSKSLTLEAPIPLWAKGEFGLLRGILLSDS